MCSALQPKCQGSMQVPYVARQSSCVKDAVHLQYAHRSSSSLPEVLGSAAGGDCLLPNHPRRSGSCGICCCSSSAARRDIMAELSPSASWSSKTSGTFLYSDHLSSDLVIGLTSIVLYGSCSARKFWYRLLPAMTTEIGFTKQGQTLFCTTNQQNTGSCKGLLAPPVLMA